MALCWTGDEFQWNFNQNTTLFTEENDFENVVCETAAILSRPQYVEEVGSPFMGEIQPLLTTCVNTAIFSLPIWLVY